MPVAVRGLNELVRAFARIDKGLAGEMRRSLRVDVGGPLVVQMKAKVDAEGLVKTGRLRGSLRPAVRGTTLVVNESARNAGYPYPAVYEFGHGGKRSFMQPVVDEWRSNGELERRMDGYLDWVEREFRA